jgi:hypothetical protein
MSTQDTGGPAFPTLAVIGDRALSEGGLTVRDWFAAKAIPMAWAAWDSGYFGFKDGDASDATRDVAGCAYQMADAMLKARTA